MTAQHAIILGSFYVAIVIGVVLELRSHITDPKPGEDSISEDSDGDRLIHAEGDIIDAGR